MFVEEDTDGNDLTGPTGLANLLVVNDGRPGEANQNCEIDSGEARLGVKLGDDVEWGVNSATGPVPTDPGNGTITDGTTFDDAGGNPALWILFRPEGPPLAFSDDCTTGPIGTGGGGIYLSNGRRDKAIVVNPLGTTRIHSWVGATGNWSS